MNELIKALINIKDPFTLLAFLAVVVLLALRTKAVPELFFGLLKDKLTKEKFAHLLHRMMVYGLAVFVILAGLAVLAQILAYKAKAQPSSNAEIVAELKNLKADEATKQKALEEYQKSLVLIGENKFDEAINSLKASIDNVPTRSAEYTLAYIYDQQNQPEEARKHAAKAAELAHANGDSISQVKIDQLSKRIDERIEKKTAPPPPIPSGDKRPLPRGGAVMEQATRISTGPYLGQEDHDKPEYYKIGVKANQTLKVTFIISDLTPDLTRALVRLYDRDTSYLTQNYTSGRKAKEVVEYKAANDGDYFLSLEGRVRGTDYFISIE